MGLIKADSTGSRGHGKVQSQVEVACSTFITFNNT